MLGKVWARNWSLHDRSSVGQTQGNGHGHGKPSLGMNGEARVCIRKTRRPETMIAFPSVSRKMMSDMGIKEELYCDLLLPAVGDGENGQAGGDAVIGN